MADPGNRRRVADAAILGRGFRPFFLATGLYAAAGVLYWSAAWRGRLWTAPWLWPSAWHAHEMLFGVTAAAIAGFLLTSVPVWTGARPLTGLRLGALFLLWLAGRVAMGLAGVLPNELVAAIDLAFLPALGVVLALALVPARQVRNLGFLAVIAALTAANAATHAQALGAPIPATRALRFAVDLVVVLIVVIGGRITPAFTRNALERSGIAAPVRSSRWLDRAAIASVVAMAGADLLVPRSAASGWVALLAACSVAGRMAGWQMHRVLRDPLLVSLHAGLAWVPLGLSLVALSDLTGLVPPAAGLHALTAGAMGAMILAVMTRVSLGHTGRPLTLPAGAVLCYALVHLGAAFRVLSATSATSAAPGLLLLVAGLTWGSAFALFVALYAPILVRPRVDGKPG